MKHDIVCMLAALVLPIFCALGVWISSKQKILRNILLVVFPILLLADVAYMRHIYYQTAKVSMISSSVHHFINLLQGVVTIRLSVEPLGILFALLASMLWVPHMLYTIGYVEANHERHQLRFFVMLCLSMMATLGIAFADNLVTLLLFYEMLTIFTYPLVIHKGDEKTVKSGRFYITELMCTSVSFFVLLIALIHTQLGQRTEYFVSGGIFSNPNQLIVVALPLLVLCSWGVAKAALFPVNGWLPTAMVAPTPVSAFLHAVAVVKSGVFIIIKLMVYVFGVEKIKYVFMQHTPLLWGENFIQLMACASIIFATVKALRSIELKQVLAYSTMANLSYITGVVSMGSGDGVRAALFHMVAHGCAKITLFFAVGAIYTMTRKTSYKNINNMINKMPITMVCFILAASSMIGLPFTVGYHGKGNMIYNMVSSNHMLLLISFLFSSISTAFYFSRILAFACEKPAHNVAEPYQEAPWPMLTAMIATTSMILCLWIFPDVFILRYD